MAEGIRLKGSKSKEDRSRKAKEERYSKDNKKERFSKRRKRYLLKRVNKQINS